MKSKQVRILSAIGLTLAALLLLITSTTASPSAALRTGKADPVPAEMQGSRVGPAALAGSWTSGWVPIAPGQTRTFNHNLGANPDDYAVELWFWDPDGGLGMNRNNYGGLEFNGQWYGAHWQNLTANTIQVHRNADDEAADRIRVRVWVPLDPPDYDDGWRSINPNQTITVQHNLGVPATELTVGLWFRGTARGIHNFAYGGLAVDGAQRMLGAHWQNLTDNTVQVARHPHDTDIEQVRVIVVRGAPPTYDSLQALSGWKFIATGTTFTFNHNLNWNRDMMLVRGECHDPSGMRGIHQLFAGGNHDWIGGGQFQGASVLNLTDNTAEVLRWGDDEFCPEVRIRIWGRRYLTFLPMVLRAYP